MNSAFLIKLLSYPHAKQIAYAIMSVCVLWILLNLVETTRMVFYHASSAPAPVIVNSNNQASSHLTQIAGWHLFGQTPPAAINEQNIPISSLNLTLNGIFYQSHHAGSQAMITDANGQTQLYKTGDTVPGGVTLYEIRPDSVILQRNNQLEKLTLPNRQLQFASPPQGLP